MGKVVSEFAMSLDGFIADAQDDVWKLFRWLIDSDTALPIQGKTFKTSPASAQVYEELLQTTGALITGRRDFDVSKAWGGISPMGVPIFIVTHHPPAEWAGKESPFTFVTDGIPSALERARRVAGDKNVLVSGSKIVQQCLQLGLLDEIHIDLVPVLLGAGIRLFDNLDTSIELETTRVIAAPGVTHLRYRVVK